MATKHTPIYEVSKLFLFSSDEKVKLADFTKKIVDSENVFGRYLTFNPLSKQVCKVANKIWSPDAVDTNYYHCDIDTLLKDLKSLTTLALEYSIAIRENVTIKGYYPHDGLNVMVVYIDNKNHIFNKIGFDRFGNMIY